MSITEEGHHRFEADLMFPTSMVCKFCRIQQVADAAGCDPDELVDWVAELRSTASDADTHRLANHRLSSTIQQVRELAEGPCHYAGAWPAIKVADILRILGGES
ncbi:hypothetical protein SEA_GETALONG_83 [Gordonia phage Getalong]|uniref:Uncharacterized protein n=1 Tax=Gordonia phage Getalong TaxID=2315531 RepID=A0A386KHN8_9CAUD|nr:hypothetical protein HOU38_gp083 [Gordonia phage Getalong]AYD83943.1 hypothetical protein SEA_GETALONG_83 [Gordonia phage Getalong]UAW08325.1 hypothetical protein SEA_WHITNEY_78 [Gordonia phage Whitney]